MLRIRIIALFIALNLALSSVLAASDTPLRIPKLGENSAGLLPPAEEFELGQMILRAYRGGLPTSKDPFIESYLRNLIQTVVNSSELNDQRLELLVLESPDLNAFAAPGGIVGVNTGTFLTAQTEQQLASIIAHELAHLSQRHYARRVQKSATNATVSIAAILASLVVAASGNSDVAMAAIPAVQAASIQSSLRFSRDMEREADRIGFQNLVKGGFDPYAMSEMFELMAHSTRFRSKVPEFLMSHPVTESRIADSFSRARSYPRRHYTLDTQFQLMRSRVLVSYERSPAIAVKRFKEEAKSHHNMSEITAKYGLVLAYIEAEQAAQAMHALADLENIVPNSDIITVAKADILVLEKDYNQAVETLRKELKNQPDNHPINVRLAEILMLSSRYAECEAVLMEHVKRQPDNPYVWYLLAEVHGLAGNILSVHKARAEFFMLNGNFSKAEIQLRNALKLIDKNDFQARAKVEQRLLDVKKLQQQML